MIDKVVSIFILIIILAMLSIVLNPKSQAPKILANLFSGFSGAVTAAKGTTLS